MAGATLDATPARSPCTGPQGNTSARDVARSRGQFSGRGLQHYVVLDLYMLLIHKLLITMPLFWPCGHARYKLKAKVEDATGTMDLMIFCEVAEELVGVSAEELVDNIEEDDEWYALPDEIEDLLGSTHTFQVFDKYVNGSFAVRSIMDDASVPAPPSAASQCKEVVDPEGSQKPNKRLRGDDSIN